MGRKKPSYLNMCEPNTVPDRSEVISCADIASEMQEILKSYLPPAGKTPFMNEEIQSEYVVLYPTYAYMGISFIFCFVSPGSLYPLANCIMCKKHLVKGVGMNILINS